MAEELVKTTESETIVVTFKDGKGYGGKPVRINASEFDEKLHTKVHEKETKGAKGEAEEAEDAKRNDSLVDRTRNPATETTDPNADVRSKSARGENQKR